MAGNNGGPWGKGPTGGGQGGGGWNGGQGPRRPGPEKPDLDRLIRESQDKLRGLFNGPGGNGRVISLFVLAGLVLWGLSGIYIVQSDEQGVVLRFGRYHRTTTPGLHYHIPAPFETVLRPRVTKVNTEQIGFTSAEESLMLTGDRNIVDIKFVVQWEIGDAQRFLFELRNPYITVRNAAESAMREVIGKTPLARANTQGREEIAFKTKDLLQDILNSYASGIRVVNVNVQSVEPPSRVISAFKDVLSAAQDKERAINEAEAYRNDVIPKARGLAEKEVQESLAYRQRVVNEAKGSADRFTKIYTEYRQAPEVTKTRLYLDTMQQVMTGTHKVIVDDQLQGVVPFLPLDRLKPQQ